MVEFLPLWVGKSKSRGRFHITPGIAVHDPDMRYAGYRAIEYALQRSNHGSRPWHRPKIYYI